MTTEQDRQQRKFRKWMGSELPITLTTSDSAEPICSQDKLEKAKAGAGGLWIRVEGKDPGFWTVNSSLLTEDKPFLALDEIAKWMNGHQGLSMGSIWDMEYP